MTKAVIAGGGFAVLVLVLFALVAGYRAFEQDVDPAEATSLSIAPSTSTSTAPPPPAEDSDQGFLYGRVTTDDGAVYEGRLRFGGDEEAFWGDYFNGFKDREPLGRPRAGGAAAHGAPPIEIFGIEIARRERPVDLGRPFMARFGDIARIEARGGEPCG